MMADEALGASLIRQFGEEADRRIGRKKDTDRTLYHYTSLDSLMGMLETNRLWMSKGTFLNDSSELVYIAGIVRQVAEQLYEELRERPLGKLFVRELERAAEQFVSQINESGLEVYIFSLSHTKDSLALWYNYAKGEGYNIGFSADRLFGKINNLSGNARTLHGFVVYERQEQTEMLRDFLLNSLNQLEKVEPAEAEAALPDFFFLVISTCAVFFKEPAFRSEEEYRIAFMLEEGSGEKTVLFRGQNGVIIPYITVDFEELLPITHITVGPKNNVDIAQQGIEYYLKSKGYDLDRITISKSVAALRY